MAKKCLKCGDNVPRTIWIEGKQRNCQRRKYCLSCSPFGEHNTSKLETRLSSGSKSKKCPTCGKQHDQKGLKCFACYFKHKQVVRWKKVKDYVGSSCWFCGYSRSLRNLCFHHVDPKTKLFGLSTREMMLKWDRILLEMKKCVFCCANCHGEIHDLLISSDRVVKIWKEHWNDRQRR